MQDHLVKLRPAPGSGGCSGARKEVNNLNQKQENSSPLSIIKANQIQPKEVQWLWYPYIPYGKITLLQGDPGDGKSRFILTIAALLTQGLPLPFQEGPASRPITVLYQTTEDDMDDTVVPRFLAAGGNAERLCFIDEREKPLSFADPRIPQAVHQTGAKLLVLDPLSSYIGRDVSINMANDVRSQFNPLIQLAKTSGCAIVVVAHMNKMAGTKAIYRSSGSIDVVGAVRSSLLIARTGKERPDERIMVVQKSNLAPTGTGILFSAGETVQWISQVDKTADEVLSMSCPAPHRPSDQFERAKELLQDLLADGPMPQSQIQEKVTQAGIGWGTAKKAKSDLGVISFKSGAQWLWRLEESPPPTGQQVNKSTGIVTPP